MQQKSIKVIVCKLFLPKANQKHIFVMCEELFRVVPTMYFCLLISNMVNNLPTNAEDKKHRFEPWVGKIPWKRPWQPTPLSCLENPMDRGAWPIAVHRVPKRQTWLKRLSTKRIICNWNYYKLNSNPFLLGMFFILWEFWKHSNQKSSASKRLKESNKEHWFWKLKGVQRVPLLLF